MEMTGMAARMRDLGSIMRAIMRVIFAAAVLANAHIGRAPAQTPKCEVPVDVPNEYADDWCARAVGREGPGEAYALAAQRAKADGRHCEALRLAERGAFLESGLANLFLGDLKQAAACGKRDLPGAIVAYESAVKLRLFVGARALSDLYKGRGVWREYRDPAKAMMWAWVNYLVSAPPHDDTERSIGRELGLTKAEIDEERERMRRWLAEHKVHMRPRRWLCMPYQGKVPAECLR